MFNWNNSDLGFGVGFCFDVLGIYDDDFHRDCWLWVFNSDDSIAYDASVYDDRLDKQSINQKQIWGIKKRKVHKPFPKVFGLFLLTVKLK